MIFPNMTFKPTQQTHKPNQMNKSIEIQKISGLQRTRWDVPIQVPETLYQKFKVPPPASQRSLQTNKVNNNQPPSLIDFIKRAYNKCKDNASMRKAMENELRQIIQKNKSNLSAVNWDNFPIPQVTATTSIEHEKTTVPAFQYLPSNSLSFGFGNVSQKNIQKQTIKLPSSLYNQSLIDKIQKPSNQIQNKTKQLVNKNLLKFQQKYETQEKPKGDQVKKEEGPTKTFIGFKDQSQVRIQMLQQRYSQKSQQNKIQSQPKPQHPQKIAISKEPINISSNIFNNPLKVQSLKVIESKEPQRIYEFKKIPESMMKKQQNKQKQQKITKKDLQAILKSGNDDEDFKTKAKRFAQFNKVKPIKNNQFQEQVEEEQLDFKIVGKCKNIDKPYLRITHRPDPDTVRPESVLRKAFNHYKAEYKKGVSYDLILSQFRSIRQDLTVQDIRNSFTVEVYEQNLRMSLFEDDSIQMKQCQTNLWQLYRQGLYNKRADRTKFISYHFMGMILQQRYKQLQYMLTLIPAEVLEEKLIQQTLKLKRYLVIGNYNAFFTFYSSQDQTCQKLMNYYIDKVRVKCLLMISKTFGQKISFEMIGQNIGEDQDVLQALAKEEGATISQGYLMLKESYDTLKKSEYLQVKKVTSLLD